MTISFNFAKYVGCGNDFILFDNRQNHFPSSDHQLIQKLCHRQWGIGADGVILLEASSHAHGRMRIFNVDGSEAEMCGNGIRCLVHWMGTLGILPTSYQIETMHRTLKAWNEDSQITIEMGPPTRSEWNIPFEWKSIPLTVHYLDTGVPHCILFVENVDAIDLASLGPFIRHHSLWQPKGTNVSIAQRLKNDTFKVRTFERGVEGETLACGTGATAVALAAAKLNQLKSPLKIQTLSESVLTIGFKLKNHIFSDVTMTGPATCTFCGTVKI